MVADIAKKGPEIEKKFRGPPAASLPLDPASELFDRGTVRSFRGGYIYMCSISRARAHACVRWFGGTTDVYYYGHMSAGELLHCLCAHVRVYVCVYIYIYIYRMRCSF